MLQKRYYLNNVTNAAITLQLSAKRTINAKASLPLNNKDIAMFKLLKVKRRGKASILDGLRLSTIPIEQDSNYVKLQGVTEEALKAELEAQANEVLEQPENQSVKDFLEGDSEDAPEDTTEISEEETVNLEAQAMAELEANMVETPAEEPTTEPAVEKAKEEPAVEKAKEEPAVEETTTEEAPKQNKRAKNANK